MTTRDSTGEAPRTGISGFVVLIAISALGPLGINMLVPSLAGIGRDLGVDYGVAQLAFSVFPFSMAFFIVLAGPLADMFGRRPVLFTGLGAYVLATLAAALAPNMETLIAARIVQAAGASTGMVVGRAAIGDLFDRDRAASAMGYVTMGYGIAPMLAPLIGGVLDELYGWRSSLWFLALLGCIISAAAWLVLPETSRSRRSGEDRPTFVSAVSELAGAPAFWVVALTNMFNSSVYFTYLGGGSYAGVHLLGLSPATYGSYLMLVVVGYMTGNLFTGRFTVRIGPTRLMVAGCAILILVVLFMWGSEATGHLSPITLFVPTLFMGFGNGLVTPNCLALAMSVRPRLAGTAVGLASGLQLAFCALAATNVGWWIAAEESALPLMLQLMTVATLAFIGSLIARRVFLRAETGNETSGEQGR